jgi:hypothetical protein
MKKSNKKSTLSGTTEINFLGTKTYIKSTPPIINKLTKNKVIENDGYSKSIDDYLEKKKNEVPLYDPLTGEPNPYYEKLTGKKNPLTITPKTLNPSIREVKLKNRFLVHLPKILGIDFWDINKVEKPIISFEHVTLFGLKLYTKNNFSTLKLTINNCIGSKNKFLLDYLLKKEKFIIKLEDLDPTGEVVETMVLDDCSIIRIDFSDLDYSSNTISSINLEIIYNNIEIK